MREASNPDKNIPCFKVVEKAKNIWKCSKFGTKGEQGISREL